MFMRPSKTNTETVPAKIDIVKAHPQDYAAPRKPRLVDIDPATYLAIDGQGAPGGPNFEARIGALYAMAYTIKMTRKFNGEQDYTIGKLEALWWADSAECFASAPRESWRWKLLIRTPEFIEKSELVKARDTLHKRGKATEAEDVRLETLHEGKCVQMLHVGPYDRENETVAEMKRLAEGKGFRFNGLHHEIYLSDPRRIPAERLKTILRQPVTAEIDVK
jgi:hypothetical protein